MNQASGKVTIAPKVLVSIARLTALATPGVAYICSTGICALFGGRKDGGVSVTVEGNLVTVDVRIAVEHGVNILQVSRSLQSKIARAIQNMVGMEVAAVNIYIDEVEFLPES
jgi:uncharacterized alkaline shock family protein YloU